MNNEDKKRFARYLPGYIEPQEPEKIEDIKKNTLGYINKIDIDKNKLIIDTIYPTK